MKTYAILYYNFVNDIEVLTIIGINSHDAKEYAMSHYSNLVNENNIIKVVKV